MRIRTINPRLLAVAAALSLAALTAACGPSDGSSAQAEQSSPSTTEAATPEPPAAQAPAGGDAAPTPARFEVTADSFSFEPAEIRVRAGQEVEVVLTSDDMAHNFTIDELDVVIEAGEGETATGRFTPTTPGTYEFYCSISGHRGAGMEGTLVVEG